MTPDQTALHELAYSQDGLFTTAQARECGISRQLLARHVERGRYQRVGRGLYRIPGFPASTHEEVWAKWLSVGAERAVISHESALELYELSDVLPDRVHLTVDRRHRWIRPPAGVVLHTATVPLTPDEVMTRSGFRVTSPIRSVLDAASGGTGMEQIEMSVRQALAQGLFGPADLAVQAERWGPRVARSIQLALVGSESS